jgi:hypothetical protein
MNAPREGQRVRVSYEATYCETSPYAGHIVTFAGPDGDQYRAGVPMNAEFEVIVPPIKVGDVVTADNIGQLPPWSIVARRDEGLAIQRERNCVWMCRGVGIPKGDLIGWGDVEVLRIGGGS